VTLLRHELEALQTALLDTQRLGASLVSVVDAATIDVKTRKRLPRRLRPLPGRWY